MKKFKFLMMFILTIALTLVFPNTVKAISVNTVTSSMLIDEGYGWSFQFVKDVTTTEAGGMTNYSDDYLMNNSQDNDPGTKSQGYSARLTSSSQKGKIWIKYKNVGTYNGQTIDLKITLVDWDYLQPANTNAPSVINGINYPTIFFRKDNIDVFMTSYPSIAGAKFRYEFFAHNTNTPINVKGHINFTDIDSGEYIDAGTGLSNMYIAANTNLNKRGDGVVCPYGTIGYASDKEHWATTLFSGEKFEFVYTRLQDQKGNSYKDVTVTTNTRSVYHYEITGESLLPIDIEEPKKAVNKSEITGTDEVVYTISHQVASESNAFYYTKYEISDNIPKCFNVKSVKVYDNFGNDRTGWFDISTNSNNKVTISSNKTGNTSFYNKTYSFKITVNRKANYNMSSWYNGNTCTIPNKATLTVAGPKSSGTRTVTKDTNTVNVNCYFNITTKITNGTITGSMTKIPGGANKAVTFAPNKGYYIESVKVDGTNISLAGYNIYGSNTYNFSNIAADHAIEVVCKPKKSVIKIVKKDIETSSITQGDATFNGAVYTIYKDAACTQAYANVTLDASGNGQTGELLLVEKVNGADVYHEKLYVKETTAPTGYNIDTNVYTVTQELNGLNTTVNTVTVTSKDEVIRNDIEIIKYLGATDSTPKQKLSGAKFKAVLKSDSSKVYYSTTTDANGYCIIKDLPYGTYVITESTIPPLAYNGIFTIGTDATRKTSFEQFVNVDHTIREPYQFADITDVPKKMQITIYKEDKETGTIVQGDARLEGAQYTLYRDKACTDAIETVTIAKNNDGTYSAKSKWYLVGTYYIKETKAPIGYLIDETVYEIYQNPAEQTGEYSNHEIYITSKEEVIRNSIEITKYLEVTDSTAKQPLAGAIFSATLNSDPTKVYYSTPTDNNGYCIIEEIPYGTYTLRESTIPSVAYNGEFYINGATERSTTFEQFIEIDSSMREPYVYSDITDVAKKMRIIVTKEDNETGIHTQGDATLAGAEYTIYRDAECTDVVETITTVKNDDGTFTATSGWFLVGKYWVKETKAPVGYNIDENVYPISQVPTEQIEEFSTHHILSKDKVMEGIVKVLKYNNNSQTTDKTPAVGAKLRLTLDSNPNVYYDAVIDENGYAEFVEEACRETCYPYTIPFGLYTISEVQASNSGEHIFIYRQKTQITHEEQTQRYILNDEIVRLRLTIQKVDAETGKVIPAAQATFKIWDVNNQKWYEELVYPSGESISEFTTNDKGELTINRHLEAGGYVIYETQAPYGYYLDDTLRVDNIGYEFNIGVKGNGEVVVYHEDEEAVLDAVLENYDNIPTRMYYYTAVVEDPPQKAIIKITDLAEQFTKVDVSESEYGSVNEPVFEEVGLEGAEFDIIAKEDIYTPEGTKRYSKGQVVSHITTNKDGIAESVEIYLGKYQVVQTVSPDGYILDKTPIDLDIVYTNQYERVQIIPLEIKQKIQDVNLSFDKIFKELEVSRFKFENQKAIFGIYTKETIRNYKGESTIAIDELVEIIETDENNKVVNKIQLPEGKYYVKELDVTNPYTESNDQYDFKVEHLDSLDKTVEVTINNGKVVNEAKTVGLEILVYPDVVYEQKDIANIQDKDILEELAKEYGIAGKTYQVFHDKECTKPVITIEDKEATFDTNEDGIVLIPDMPIGTYYFKEIVAPYGYELSDEVIEAKLDGSKELVILTASEPMKKGDLLEKTDAFTKDVIANCEFEITDEEGNVIYTALTNEEGILKVPVIYFENGKTYYYQEINAPKTYMIDEEKYEFVAEYDEEKCEWTLDTIDVINTRNTIEEVIIRKVDDETGEPLKDCEFTVVLLDENGEEYVNKNGQKIYLVEKVLTDENGEYIIKNVPYGTYKFIEVTPPEGYELDANFEGIIFTVDENSPDTIIFEVTNTGDIAVYTLSAMAILSILGISFVMIKNLRKAKINA